MIKIVATISMLSCLLGCMDDTKFQKELIANANRDIGVLSPHQQEIISSLEHQPIPTLISGNYRATDIGKKNGYDAQAITDIQINTGTQQVSQTITVTVKGLWQNYSGVVKSQANYNWVGSTLHFSNVTGDLHTLPNIAIEPIDNNNFYEIDECTQGFSCNNALHKILFTRID